LVRNEWRLFRDIGDNSDVTVLFTPKVDMRSDRTSG